GSCQLCGAEVLLLGEQAVEPLEAVELTVPARLDHAGGEEDDRGPVLARPLGLVVVLIVGNPECEPGRPELEHPVVGADQPSVRVTGARTRELARAGVDGPDGPPQ